MKSYWARRDHVHPQFPRLWARPNNQSSMGLCSPFHVADVYFGSEKINNHTKCLKFLSLQWQKLCRCVMGSL